MNDEKVKKFIKAVCRMRACQTNYFKSKKRNDLIASKIAEKEVDAILFELRQTELF